MSTRKTKVFCTLSFEGIHNWPGCPIDEVRYLRDLHRHIFHVRAVREVSHDDRDVEFIWFKHRIEQFIQDRFEAYDPFSKTRYLGATSCEYLANELMDEFDLCECEVNEDGENGSIVTRID